MFDYLQKFNNLPKDLRDQVSSPAAMTVISDLEKKYKIDLAATVMKVMVKIIPLADLSIYFVSDFSLDQETAKKLTADLKERLFFSVANYLGYNPSYSSIVPKTAPAPAHLIGVEKIIKDSGVVFPGAELNSRFKQVLITYLKGVRSRVDTRLTLNKEIISGGLGLDYKVIDKIFKSADEIIAAASLPSEQTVFLPKIEKDISGLNKVRAEYEKQEVLRDIPYDLKKAITTGTIKKPEAPLNLPTPTENQEKLLTEPVEKLKIANTSNASSNLSLVNSDHSKLENIKTPIEPQPAKTIISEPKIATNKIEIKLAEDVKTPEIKPNLPKVPVTPVVIPVINPVAGVKLSETAANFIPADHKITRPPEKKVNLLSKLLTSKPETDRAETETKTTADAIIKPIKNVPITSLRNEALSGDNQKKSPAIKATVTAAPEVNNTPKIMGPVEELAYLDIINFRRLGASPAEAILKIEEKIKLLERDGYDKMISGVIAWRSGIINSLYLKMGLESLTKGISLKENADNYQNSKNLAYLTWEEIEQIIILNNHLMF